LNSTPFEISFPPSLPVSGHRGYIMTAMREHQVVIVCGETGSGKTTQLPKIALAMGRGKLNYPNGNGKMIGHTQPRRIAASTVAKRIAQELNTPLGDVVGFKVRFLDRIGNNTSIKLMTDGILLAETQSDPLLNAYDTLIIDEAHERSLNIDFLLGYLRQILPRRPDLKIVVTSATIDAKRFADHFFSSNGPAPIITVSGRTFPVEQLYKPFQESPEFDINHAIAESIDELWRRPSESGDILIFLPGEREIREAADHLRRYFNLQPLLRGVEVLPLYARLSQTEQDRIFDSHSNRRIVLATNVAETSLTVPGIRFVIDTGLARIKRYNFRSKVEQLIVEPVSQSSANQRTGRCGRVANGICIRLYDVDSFNKRPKFTDPEILRSSLAGIILKMKSLHLGSVEDFPFLESPSSRAITDGYQLLHEIGAVDDRQNLTTLGSTLSKLPLDPRVGRMLIEAEQRGALDEILVIASALSVQDVRDRPSDLQEQADFAHIKFDDEKSEFTGYLKLWRWIKQARGGDGKKRLSNRHYEQLLRQNFINIRRVREWADIFEQLKTVVAEHKWRLNTLPSSYEQLHMSILAGLIGNIGSKIESQGNSGEYLGARGIKFYPHPGAHLLKKPNRWLVVSELIETNRLYGRGIAAIDPNWVEQVGGHLLKKELVNPHWEKKSEQVVSFERGTLYGLLIYSGRRVNLSRIDLVLAREIFIREALVGELWNCPFDFLTKNKEMIVEIEEIEHKGRRQDVLVDEELIFNFYDQLLPGDVCSGESFQKWYDLEVKKSPDLLLLSRDNLMRHRALSITNEAFPKLIRLGGVDCPVSYLYDPGSPKDGLTVSVELFALNKINSDRCEWLVPGLLKEKIQSLLKTLNQRYRSRLLPLEKTALKISEILCNDSLFGIGSLIDVVVKWIREEISLEINKNDFKVEMLSPHHLMNFIVIDENGRHLTSGRNLSSLKATLGLKATGAFQALASLNLESSENIDQEILHNDRKYINQLIKDVKIKNYDKKIYSHWGFGELPELMEITRGDQTVYGYPALVDVGNGVGIEIFDEPDKAHKKNSLGLRKLFSLQLKDVLKYLEKNIPSLQSMGLIFIQIGKYEGIQSINTLEELRDQIVNLSLERAFLIEPLPTDELSFKNRLTEGRSRLTLISHEVAKLANEILLEYSFCIKKLKDGKYAIDIRKDITEQLHRLVNKNYLLIHPWPNLKNLPRYLKAIQVRLSKYALDPSRDNTKIPELKNLERKFYRLVADRNGHFQVEFNEFKYLIEELRVSFFAQELRTPQPVSIKRLEKVLEQLNL